MIFKRGLAFLAVVLLAGCAHVHAVRGARPAPPARPAKTELTPHPAAPAAVPPIDLPCMRTSHGCIALNSDVAAESLAQTVCVTGYTATVRPSTTYTNGVKAKLLRESGLDASHMTDYELDHIIPLGVGGNPRKLSNLALQPWDGENSAKEKDKLERRLQQMVCRGRIKLAAAQFCIAEDWHKCRDDIAAGRVIPGGKVVTKNPP